MTSIDFGYRQLPIRGRLLSARLPLRVLVVSALVLVLAGFAALVSVTYGDFPLSLGQVVRAIVVGDDSFHRMIVLEWRLPVAVVAIAFGAALGLGGAIFQSITRNPLGSPDIIGFDTGAFTAVALTMLVLRSHNYWTIATAALIGGLATALVVYLLSYRSGTSGFRLIIVGIGISAMLGSINSFLITRADVNDAMVVGFWSAGSISGLGWSTVLPSLGLVALLCLLAGLLAPSLRRLELGDDAAVTHGSRPGRARLALMVVGVACTALVTAAAGPIGFVALMAPQIARRVTRSPGVSLGSAAAMGALLLTAAHLVSLIVDAWFRPVPIGLVTVCIGGGYLIWLLIAEARRQLGGPR